MDEGEKIKQLRLANSMSQDYIAERLGVTRSTISSYEIGRRKLSYHRAKQLGRIFHVKPEFFFENDNKGYTFYVDNLNKKEYLTFIKIYENLKNK